MTQTIMPAGRYYVGDLCYVMHPQWDEFCHKSFSISSSRDDSDGRVTLDNGVITASFSTMYGDGTYTDQMDHEYPVDAGLIGCIKVDDISDEEADLSLGNIIEFESDFACSYDEGVITFGHISINTGYSDEDNNNEDDCPDEEEESSDGDDS